jgi:hypothetical protein
MITILSDPSYALPVSPAEVLRWLATESPNNFQLRRADWLISSAVSAGSPDYTNFEVSTDFTGSVGDSITIVDNLGNARTGVVTVIYDSPARNLQCDIPFGDFLGTPTYMNDNTLYAGYYFEGRLTVNGTVQPLTIIASPNSKGIADLDVSGVLRIMVALGKTADYTALLAAEPTKGGTFTFAYRGAWYGSEEPYTEEGNTWYYVEAVRSVEQGSNLHEYVPTETQDAPFFNAFAQPVYFLGLPFDLTFLLPVQPVTSPVTELTVTIKHYNANNTLLSTHTEQIEITGLDGKVVSLKIDPASIETTAAYLTAEITTP